MKFTASENVDTGGGNWLTESGTYHLLVVSADEEATSKDGKVLDAFRISFLALDGTVRDKDGFTEKNKTVDLLFWNPKLSSKDGGAFAHKKQTRCMIALGLMDESQLGQDVDIDMKDAAPGRQVIATLEKKEGDNGRSFLDLSFADIFHVDDPAAAKFPRNEEALGMIPKEHRRDPKSFTINEKKGGGGGKPSGGSSQPSAGDSDLDDL